MLLLSHVILAQVQGLTWSGFQSASWLLEALSEVLKAYSASPEKANEWVTPQMIVKNQLINTFYVYN